MKTFYVDLKLKIETDQYNEEDLREILIGFLEDELSIYRSPISVDKIEIGQLRYGLRMPEEMIPCGEVCLKCQGRIDGF